MAGQAPIVVALGSAGGTAGIPLGAVQVMKLANRAAQHRIARGDYPDIVSVRSSQSPERDVIEGLAA
jgi:hypothetical protein